MRAFPTSLQEFVGCERRAETDPLALSNDFQVGDGVGSIHNVRGGEGISGLARAWLGGGSDSEEGSSDAESDDIAGAETKSLRAVWFECAGASCWVGGRKKGQGKMTVCVCVCVCVGVSSGMTKACQKREETYLCMQPNGPWTGLPLMEPPKLHFAGILLCWMQEKSVSIEA